MIYWVHTTQISIGVKHFQMAYETVMDLTMLTFTTHLL